MSSKKDKRRVLVERLKHTCCRGKVYFDGRCGDEPIFIHTDGCGAGEREKLERDWWDMEGR